MVPSTNMFTRVRGGTILSILPLFFILTTFLSSTQLSEAAALVLPVPKGTKYTTTHATLKLTDTVRPSNPFDSSQGGRRAIMISLFYPVPHPSCDQTCKTPYMPSKTASYLSANATFQYGAPAGSLERISMEMCCKPCASAIAAVGQFPLVLFSPGLPSSRLLFGRMAAKLASGGYVVVTIDHTFDSLITEFPDGSVAIGKDASYFNIDTLPQEIAYKRYTQAITARELDARFVLTQLGKREVVKALIPESKDLSLNTKQVAMFGHSFGGATAIDVLAHDPRFSGAINLDGTQFGLTPSDNITKPVLLFGRAAPNNHNLTSDPTWGPTWEQVSGWRREISLKDSGHENFGDRAALMELRGLLHGSTSKRVKVEFGSINGVRGLEVVGAYVEAFMGLVLEGSRTRLFEEESAQWSEVVIARFW